MKATPYAKNNVTFKRINARKNCFASLLILAILSIGSLAAKEKEQDKDLYQSVVVSNLLEKAQKNKYWKTAFITGEQEQIVFMNISSSTNPYNEIGEETHSFDQAILIVEGRAQCILNGKSSKVKNGDLIFIPRGTPHNVINLEKEKELKIISFYSARDMPKDATYKTRADQPND